MRVLIPVTDRVHAERAVRRFLDTYPASGHHVVLVGIADPLTPGRVPALLAPSRARDLATAAVQAAIDQAAAALAAAGVRSSREMVVGPQRAMLAQQAARDDVDAVLLPGRGWRWLDTRAQARLSRNAGHPVLVVE